MRGYIIRGALDRTVRWRYMSVNPVEFRDRAMRPIRRSLDSRQLYLTVPSNNAESRAIALQTAFSSPLIDNSNGSAQ
jgi:hypothetical protein